MVRVTHNGETERREVKAAHLGELVAQLLATCPEPSVATGLWVNGDRVPDESLAELDAVPLAGLEELRLESQTVRTVALRSVESAAEFSDQVRAALCRSAELMRAGTMDDALALYTQGLDGLSVLLFVFDSAAGQLGEAAATLDALGSGLRPRLEALTEAQEQADWIRVADCLQYEIAPILADAAGAAAELQRHAPRA